MNYLILEASNDDKFADHMRQIMKAITALEKLMPDMKLTSSQKTSLVYAVEDLQRLAKAQK